MFLVLPDPDPLVRGTDSYPDLAPDPSFSHKDLEQTEIMLGIGMGLSECL